MSAPLPTDTVGRNDPCPCGSGKKFKKCCMEKNAPAASAPAGGGANMLLHRAEVAYGARNFAEAVALAKEALAVNPREVHAAHLIANVCFHRGQYAAAEEWICQCITMDGRNGLFYFTYGVILHALGRIDEALLMTEKALSLKPPNLLHSIYTNMGTYLHEKREIAAAIECYDKALAAKADYAPAFFRRGVAYFTLMGARSAEMKADLERAIALDPGNVSMFLHIAKLYLEINDFVQAITTLRHALGLQPEYEDAWVLLAHAHFRIGDTATALNLYQQLAQKYPSNPTVKLELAYMFPATAMSDDDITLWRDRCMENLDRLMQENFHMQAPERHMLYMPFYQAFHGRNNLQMAKKLAEFFLHSCPGLRFTAPHCARARRSKERIRVGFVSELFHSYVLSQFYGPLLAALAQDERFEVVLIASSAQKNERVEEWAAAIRYVMLPAHLAGAQQAVAAEKIDILIYLDIGMNVMNYLLAFARLAPVQMVMGGHPVTTGIPNMDYFITSRVVEPENCAEHYSEKLLMLKKNAVVFRRRRVPAGSKTRAQLGLPPDARLYACPVMLFKLHPDMDKVFASILARDDRAVIILFDSEYKTLWRFNLEKRFTLSMPPEHAARIRFLSYAPGDQFHHVMRSMDCVLDTLHFSFGTTAFLMLAADVPFVTLLGEFQRGRAGMMLYKQMGMPELIARSQEHFVELALKLAQDKEFHKRMQEAIRANSRLVFDDMSVIAPFTQALADVYGETEDAGHRSEPAA